MKKLLPVLLLFLSTGLFSCATSQPQRYSVKVRPAAPVVRVRPPMPAPGHIWVNGEWVWSGRGYVWKDGYWLAPRVGHQWQSGHWRKQRGGWYWVGGHWR